MGVLTTGRMLVLGVLAALSFLGLQFADAPPWAEMTVVLSSGSIGAVALIAGIRRHRPAYRLPWYLTGASYLSSMLGGFLTYLAPTAGFEWPSPGLPEVFFLLQYPLAIAPLVLWMHRRGESRDPVAWIDMATIVVALGTLSWLFLVVPVISAPGVPLVSVILSALYPTLDLLVLGTGLRILFSVGRTVPALLFVLGAFGCFTAADALIGTALIYLDNPAAVGWMTALFMPGFPLVGAAALHPSMAGLSHRADSLAAGSRHADARRLPLLALALGVGPVALSVGHYLGDDDYVPIYAAAGVVLSTLVMTRMWLLIQQQRWLAVTDGLTGLRTRRYFEEALTTAIARNARAQEAFGVLLLDVDYFKKVNDTRGHGAGDRVLQELAQRLLAVVRADDVVARYGGEEFAVLLAHAGPNETRRVAERLRGTIAAEPVLLDGGPPVPITVSIGVAAGAVPGAPADGAELMLQADHCLYAAKEQGRDRVVAGPEFDRVTA